MRILVAMSGGVDSSVAAALLVKAGHEVIGATFKLFPGDLPGSCCGLEGSDDARAVARKLGIRHYVMDFSKAFKETVVDDFIDNYLNGSTPNPCIRCNQFIKFGIFLTRARVFEAQAVATGHYARVAPGPCGQAIYQAIPGAKDQSYFLFSIPREVLREIVFPLGTYTKDMVRLMAASLELPVAQKEESQDICFISAGKTYGDFIASQNGRKIKPGPIVDSLGNVLGRHRGLAHYTVGQRRGLGIHGEKPLYVKRLDPENNTLVVGNQSEIIKRDLAVDEVVLHEDIQPDTTLQAEVKIRYRHKAAPARVSILENRQARVVFREPQWAVSPGQAAVFYRDGRVIGGGWITRQKGEG